MKLSVVIVNYNVKHFLEQCLTSVFNAKENLSIEVFVVDNNSVDGSVDMIQQNFPEVKCIANKENVGFSSANNQAIDLAQGEYVLLLNPDTIVPENCFTKTVAYLDENEKVGGLGVHMVDGQGNFLPESKRGLPTPETALYKMIGLNKLFPKSKKFGKYHLGYLPNNETHEVDVLSGAFMMLRRKTLDEVGTLDETFFMYGEDIDLSYRITKAGWKNVYFADTSIIHYKGESTKKLSTNYVRVFYKAMAIFAKKHYSGGNQNAFTLLINLAIFGRAGLTLVANFFRKFWMVLFEAFLIFISMYFLKEYWIEHIKYLKEYPPEMMTIHLPYYTFVWIVTLWFLGSYNHKFNFTKLIKALLLGTGIILVIYGLLPNHLHFSRGIILFGTLLVTGVLIFWRSLLHLLRYKTLDFSQRNNTKSILVGSPERWKKVSEMLKSYNKSYHQLGFVNAGKSDHPNYLGGIHQLKEMVKIYGVNEIIFSGESVSTEETMNQMAEIGPNVNYYTIPANSNFVIGSHSKNATGLYFGEHIRMNLSKPEFRNQKRAFDITASLVLLILSPLFIFIPSKRKLLRQIWPVLVGNKTWMSYSLPSSKLPTLKPGVLSTDYVLQSPSPLFQENLDRMYAKDYRVWLDFKAVFT